MWPLILAAIGLWLIVYCLIVAQRCLTHECECNNTPSGAVAERKRAPKQGVAIKAMAQHPQQTEMREDDTVARIHAPRHASPNSGNDNFLANQNEKVLFAHLL